MQSRREFTVSGLYTYDSRSPWRWIMSHVMRYKLLGIGAFGLDMVSIVLYTSAPLFVGQAAQVITTGQGIDALIPPAVLVLGCLVGDGVFALMSRVALENLAQRFEVDARQELYA